MCSLPEKDHGHMNDSHAEMRKHFSTGRNSEISDRIGKIYLQRLGGCIEDN